MSPATLRTELRSLIEGWNRDLDDGLRDDTSLIRSGVLDSVALFQLVLWLEEKLGQPVNPAEYDLISEWDTIDDILGFIEKQSAE